MSRAEANTLLDAYEAQHGLQATIGHATHVVRQLHQQIGGAKRAAGFYYREWVKDRMAELQLWEAQQAATLYVDQHPGQWAYVYRCKPEDSAGLYYGWCSEASYRHGRHQVISAADIVWDPFNGWFEPLD